VFDSSVPPDLPPDFPAWTLTATWERNTIGHSACDVYRITALDGTSAHAKIGPAGHLASDRVILAWLKDKRLPVPELLSFNTASGRDVMLMTTIEGEHAASDSHLAAPELTVVRYAEALRLIHAIPASGCPINRHLDYVLSEAAERVRLGLVDADDFEPAYDGRPPEELLAMLRNNRPEREELVFTHGDYCMPNLLLQDGAISGIIDWGSGGIADRYQDIALAVRSLGHNGLADYVPLFLSSYGIEEPDRARIQYYILLDELF
jgi:aminoglycoside phosphotransferase